MATSALFSAASQIFLRKSSLLLLWFSAIAFSTPLVFSCFWGSQSFRTFVPGVSTVADVLSVV